MLHFYSVYLLTALKHRKAHYPYLPSLVKKYPLHMYIRSEKTSPCRMRDGRLTIFTRFVQEIVTLRPDGLGPMFISLSASLAGYK